MPARLTGPLGAILSGLLLAVTFPFVLPDPGGRTVDPSGWLESLAFVALVPLLVVSLQGSLRRALGLALLSGGFFFGLSLYWIAVALTRFGGLSTGAAVPVVVGVVLYCAIHWCLAVGFAWMIRRHLGLSLGLALPVTWTAAELLRNDFVLGSPWCSLGHTLARTPALNQIVSLGGVYLVVALVAGINGVLAETWLRLRARPMALSRRGVLLGLGGASLAILLGLGYSAAWRAHLETAVATAPRLKVAVVQGNVDQRIRNAETERRAFVLRSYLPLTESLARAGAELVVWPEAAWPGPLPTLDFQALPELTHLRGAGLSHYLLSGTTTLETEAGTRRTNTAWLVGPDLSLQGTHQKTRLLPFGEYVPLEGLLPLRQVVPGAGSFVPGTVLAPLSLARDGAVEARLGEMICYEAVFPELARTLTDRGANLLLNTSNDAWYGATSAPHQFLQMVALRAAENGRYLVRAANTGVSAIIDPSGVILEQTALGLAPETGELIGVGSKVPPESLVAEVPLLELRTPYSYLGDSFAYLCTFLAAVGFGLAVVRAGRPVV